MSVVESVTTELEALGAEAAGSAMAATALALAARIDNPKTSSTSVSMCSKALIDVLREVRSLAPPKKENDELSRLRAERDKRRSGFAASADSARP